MSAGGAKSMMARLNALNASIWSIAEGLMSNNVVRDVGLLWSGKLR